MLYPRDKTASDHLSLRLFGFPLAVSEKTFDPAPFVLSIGCSLMMVK